MGWSSSPLGHNQQSPPGSFQIRWPKKCSGHECALDLMERRNAVMSRSASPRPTERWYALVAVAANIVCEAGYAIVTTVDDEAAGTESTNQGRSD